MNAIWWLILGLLAGWLIELAIDYLYWRRQAKQVAVRQAARDAELDQRSQALDGRQQSLQTREAELNDQQSTQNARDAELLALARRLDERSDEFSRLEQQLEKRRADVDRMALTLNERDREIAGRHEALKALEADASERTKVLSSNEQDVARRAAVVSNRESAMSSWETRILAREREVADREALLAREAAQAEAARVGFAKLQTLVSRQYRTADGGDDLAAIEGVGPKIAELLHDADIHSFERLSETPVGELTRILEAGGRRFGLADPMTWADQAGLLVAGDYLGFEALKARLRGGVPVTDGPAAAPSGEPDVPPTASLAAQADTVAEAAAALEAAAGDIGQGLDPSTDGRPLALLATDATPDPAADASPGAAADASAGAAAQADGTSGQAVDETSAAATGTVLTEVRREPSAGPLFDALDEPEAASVGPDADAGRLRGDR